MKLATYQALEAIRTAGIEITYTKDGFDFKAKDYEPELVAKIITEIFEHYLGEIEWSE